jgi:hypothetical protein
VLKEDPMRRALSNSFLHELNPKEDGRYGNLVKRVRRDKDLDLEFRGNCINLYYHGHSILSLKQNGTIGIHKAFTTGGLHRLPEKITGVEEYLKLLPLLKDNVSCHVAEDQQGRKTSKSNRELEFEQLLIRANNREITCNSDYIILDRQYRLPDGRRIDLIALRYSSGGKPKGNLSIIEVKYTQNRDIQDIKSQLEAYGQYLQDHLEDISRDMQQVLRQKLALGLVSRSPDRLKWLNRDAFVISQDIASTEILVYLIDYNPKSQLIARAAKPSFAGRVRCAFGGLALWQSRFEDFKGLV